MEEALVKRVLPHSIEAEQSVIGSMLMDRDAIIAASEPLVPGGTHAVLGEGPVGADVAFVGEQPGDQEDRQGRPFVGPAGQLLDRAMVEAGLDRAESIGSGREITRLQLR